MDIIAWNQSTDTAIDPERAPIDGEWARFTDGDTVSKHQYHEPVDAGDVYITSMSRTDFKGMFTATEYRAISVEASTDDNVFQFWDMAQTADHVDLEDSRTMMGMAYLVSVGIFDQTRHDEIMLGKLQ